MFAVIDCGSVKTRVYIVDNNQVIGKSEVRVGVNDTISSGSRQKLRDGIREAVLLAAVDAAAPLACIQYVIAAGMITSEIGLLEVPHFPAPAGVNELADNALVIRDTAVFPLDLPVVFVRGIKNNCGEISWDQIRGIDLMRGEETQVIGILAKYSPQLPVNIIELGSTTKFIHVDEQGRIAGSITSMSGQVYDAVRQHTFIGGCIAGKETQPPAEPFFSQQILESAVKCVEKAGFLRTLLFTRFLQFSLPTTFQERRFFMEAAIAADDMKIFDEAKALGFSLETEFILVGVPARCILYDALIKTRLNAATKIISITEQDDIDALAVLGAAEIASRAAGLSLFTHNNSGK